MKCSPPSMRRTGRLLTSIVDRNARLSVEAYVRAEPRRDIAYCASRGFSVCMEEMHSGSDRNKKKREDLRERPALYYAAENVAGRSVAD
jgi:hypothetical protein